MKKFVSMLAVMLLMVAMCFAFAACSSDETTDPGDDQNVTSNEDGFKVGAIYTNSKNDTAGYTFKHHQGITTAMENLGLDPETDLVIVDEVEEDY